MSDTQSPSPAENQDATTAAACQNEQCGCAPGEQGHYGYSSKKDAYLKRLRRIEGQVRGIQRMVDEDKYCIDILTQISAINKALHAVSVGLLEEHIWHCVVGAAVETQRTGDQSILDNKVKEATAAISRLMRS